MPPAPAEVRFRDVAPEFAEELAALVLADGDAQLAEQVLSAEIVARCRCEDAFCASFYAAAAPPEGAYGPGHDSVPLDPAVGAVALDVVDGRLVYVEVLHHDAFRRTLHAAVPCGQPAARCRRTRR
ncbi:MAG TPA: hypothetical protein VGD56_06740 [Gemmatirosa sp.]